MPIFIFISLSGVAVAIFFFAPTQEIEFQEIQKHYSFLTDISPCVIRFCRMWTNQIGEPVTKNSKVFDIIVLAGMVVNIILAVFLILYYFDFL
ncbi:MAG: hypothetical protein NTAFB01_10660 [Nitrospira sp.]